jgi:hypothetical protein
LNHLVEKIIPEQAKNKRGIPGEPMMELPSRKKTKQLGTKALDVDDLDKMFEKKKEEAIEEAKNMRERDEDGGTKDRYEKLQPTKPKKVDETLVGAEIEQLWIFTEKNGKEIMQWCQGKVVAVKKNSKVHIKWRKDCLRDGDPAVTEERLLISKYNKHMEEAWRFNVCDS